MAFTKGQSGNPSGRKRGSRNKATVMRDALERKGRKLLDVIIAKAEAGDIDALKFLVGRLIPPARELPSKLDIPDDANLSQLGAGVISSMMRGEISASEAQAAIAVLRNQSELAAHDDLEARVAKLEQLRKED